MGNETAAIGDLEMLVERVDPEFSNGWYRLANLYQHAGRPADAAKALAKFHAIKTAQTDSETEYLRKLFFQNWVRRMAIKNNAFSGSRKPGSAR